MGSRPITFPWLWPSSDHEPHCQHVPTNIEGGPNLLYKVDDDSHMAGIYSDCSTGEINNNAGIGGSSFYTPDVHPVT